MERTGKTRALLNRSIIFGSQYPNAVDLDVAPLKGSNQMLVTFKYRDKNGLHRLRYDTAKTEHGWRVYDLYNLNKKYSLRNSLGGKP